MKTNRPLLAVVLGVLTLLGSGVFGQIAGTPRDETPSENGRFTAEFSGFETRNPLIAVFRKEGEARTLVWSRSLVKEVDSDDQNPMQLIYMQQARRILSNDGSTLFVLPRFSTGIEAELRIFTQSGADQRLSLDELGDMPGAGSEGDSSLFFQVLPVSLEDPPVQALWFAQSDKWLVFSSKEKKMILPDAVLRAKLDEAGLAKAREIARNDQPNKLRQMIESARRRALEFLPGGVQPAGAGGGEENDLHSAYRFLAARKNPQDRILIERLLQAKVNTGWAGWGRGDGDIYVATLSPGRILADELLSKWDGKAVTDDEQLFPIVWMNNHKRNFFGKVSGTVYLPFEAPDNSHSVWIYLVPENVKLEGEWTSDPSVLKAAARVGSGGSRLPRGPNPFGPAADDNGPDHVHFLFDTIPPGNYRLKAIWDRRPPFAQEFEPGAAAKSEPGDYESDPSAVIQVNAGSNIAAGNLECTNRVGKADQYFAADDLWRAGHPGLREESELVRARTWAPPKTIFSAPVGQWIMQTNDSSGGVQITRVRLVESEMDESRGRRRNLEVQFLVPPAGKRNESPYYEAVLEDEHGCRFPAGSNASENRRYSMFFEIVPYWSQTLKFYLTRQDQNDFGPQGPRKKQVAFYTLKNLLKTDPAKWEPDSLPAKRDLDLVTIELAQFNPQVRETSQLSHRAGMPTPPGMPGPQHEIHFLKNGAAAKSWRKLSGKYVDRWGNESTSLSDFCRAETVFKYSIEIARDPDKRNFLPDELWEVPLEKIPGPGESIRLDATNTLQGAAIRVFAVSGTGEFVYKSGVLVSATDRIESPDRFSACFLPNMQRTEPKLRVMEDPRNRFYAGPPRPKRATVTLSARTTHVVCRLPWGPGKPLVGLLDQDTSVADPLNAPSENRYGPHFPQSVSELRILALDYKPGETGRKLTFVAQKLRTAEFFVTVSAADRPNQGE